MWSKQIQKPRNLVDMRFVCKLRKLIKKAYEITELFLNLKTGILKGMNTPATKDERAHE